MSLISVTINDRPTVSRATVTRAHAMLTERANRTIELDITQDGGGPVFSVSRKSNIINSLVGTDGSSART
jgi:hypothetical protein